MESNKRACNVLLERAEAVYEAFAQIRRKENHQEFYKKRGLRNLTVVIKKIQKYLEEFSKMNTLTKYTQAKYIEKTLDELSTELDRCINLSNFTMIVESQIHTENAFENLMNDFGEM